MAPNFEDLIQSHQFTFFVGEEEKSIIVHAAAIAATSQQLDALINGGMEESEKRCARIKDVRVDDFTRFCEYAYRGDYTVPPWKDTPPKSSKNNQHNENNDGEEKWARLSKKDKKKVKKGRMAVVDRDRPPGIYFPPAIQVSDGTDTEASLVDIDGHISQDNRIDMSWGFDAKPAPQLKVLPKSRTLLRTQLNNQSYLSDGGPKALILQLFEPQPNSAADQNFTPVLLAHARLYCFAHLRLIAPLKALALHKLHKTLMSFKLYTQRVGDIIELARYAYLNPDLPDRNDDGTLDSLRKLVVDYIVCEIDTIGKHEVFVKYMEEGGEFVGDFWKMARDYMT